MKLLDRIARIILILAFALTPSLGSPQSVLAEPGTSLVVSTGLDPITTCADAQIAIRVENVADLTAYHLEIGFDPAQVQVLEVLNGGFLTPGLFEVSNDFDNTAGTISFGMAQQNTVENPITPKSGSGDLILINLRALQPNITATFTIDDFNSALVNWPAALPIGFSVTNGGPATESCAPTANNQSLSTNEDTPLSITLSGSDPDGDTLTINYSQPSFGSVSGAAPDVLYTPNSHLHGTDSFNFTVNDGNGKTAEGTISIEVLSVLDPPTISSTDLPGPYMAGLLQEFHVSLDNPEYGDPFTNVLARLQLEGATLDDITSIEYLETAEDPDVWFPLPMLEDASGLYTYFGPVDGFPLPAPYSAVSSFRVNFKNAGSYPVTIRLYDLSADPDFELDTYSATVNVVSSLDVTAVQLSSSTDTVNWALLGGSLISGYQMALEPTEDWYYLDVYSLNSTRLLANDLYPFYFGTVPDGFFDYWAGRGVTAAADPVTWQGVMWKILQNELPIFYLKVDGANFTLVDGLTYELHGIETPLRIEGTYWPGLYEFTGLVEDEYGFTDTLSVSITFNDYPLTEDVSLSTPEETPLTILLSAVDHFPGTALSWTILDQPDHGTLTGTKPNLTYTPNLDWTGSDSFTYQAFDGMLESIVSTVTILVTGVNDAPVLNPIGDKIVDELALLSFTATAVNVDSGETLTYSLSGIVPANAVIDAASGAFSWTPDESQGPGTYTFSVTVCDDAAEPMCDSEEINVTINEVNIAPTATDDSYETDEDTPLTVTAVDGVLKNDSDADEPANPLTADLVSDVSSGTLSLAADGSFTYTPAKDYLGSVTFTYRVFDGTAYSNTATVTINVHEQNDAPVATADSYSTAEDTPLTVPAATGVLDNDTDVDGDTLTAVLVSAPASGTLTLNPDGSLTFTPLENFNGDVTFTYKAYDGIEYSTDTTVTITVTEVDDPTVALAQSLTTDEDTDLSITLSVTEVDGDTLAWTVSDPAHGTLTGTAPNLTYSPADDYNGEDSFTFSVNDGTTDSNIATVTISVTAVNDAPVGLDDAYFTDEEQTLAVPQVSGVLVNDSDIDLPRQTLTAVLYTDAANGTLVLDADGSISYIPDLNFSGTDTFQYRVFDGIAYSDLVTVTITVNPINDIPVVVNDSYFTNEDTALNVLVPGLLANDNDPDGDTLTTYLVGDGPAFGLLVFNTDGSFSYTPPANTFGTVTFQYIASDGEYNSNTGTVQITVNSVNDQPVLASVGSRSVDEETLLTFTVSATDNDVTDTVTLSISDLPDGAAFVPATGVFTWTPTEAQGPGSYPVMVSACDNGTPSACDSELVIITVNEINVAPIITGQQTLTTPEEMALEIKPADLIITDPDDSAFTVSILPGSNYTVSGSTITPASNFVGELTVPVKVNDGEADSPVFDLSVLVTPVNDAPEADDQTVSTDFETPVDITLTMWDADGDPVTWILVSGPAHGSLSGTGAARTYTPADGFSGTDSFTFKVNDGQADSNIATVTITVGEDPNYYLFLPIIYR